MSRHVPSIEQLRTGPPVVDLLTAAGVLGLGRTKAYVLAKEGRFPVPIRRVGATYRVSAAELLKYLDTSDVTPVPRPRPQPGSRPARERPVSRPRTSY